MVTQLEVAGSKEIVRTVQRRLLMNFEDFYGRVCGKIYNRHLGCLWYHYN